MWAAGVRAGCVCNCLAGTGRKYGQQAFVQDVSATAPAGDRKEMPERI